LKKNSIELKLGKKMILSTEFIAFPTRIDRSKFVAKRFAKYLNKSVLDVGCYEAPLRDILGEKIYTGIDIVGKPDVKFDLDSSTLFPFENEAFKSIICVDVLEHLNNLHFVFSELVRVSKEYIIISLPNCWRDARVPIERGRGHFAHYGLPVNKIIDRHRWFFNLSEAKQFLNAQIEVFNLKLEEMFLTEKPKNSVLRFFRRIRYPGERYMNRYSHTIWVVLKKQ
jgi:SAM-dependent methyltransferase